jgi:hypothetical protein
MYFCHFEASLKEMSFVIAQVFALRRALKLSFLLAVLTTSFGNVAKLFFKKIN